MTDAMNSERRYGTVAMSLHWLIALLVLGNLCSGFLFANVLGHDAPFRFTILQIHKSVGLTVLVLSVARLIWRLVNTIPPLPNDLSPFLKVVARATHYLFYFLIIAIPLAGWAMVSASRTGIPTLYFGLFHWPNMSFIANLPMDQKKADGHLFGTAHAWMAYSAAALIVLHVSAALWHHYHFRDTVLKRMWFGTDVSRRPA